MKSSSSSSAGTVERPVGAPGLEAAEGATPGAGPRLAPHLSLEPVAWWERQCPSCSRSFARNVAVCPIDATPLKRVEVSLPFLWLG